MLVWNADVQEPPPLEPGDLEHCNMFCGMDVWNLMFWNAAVWNLRRRNTSVWNLLLWNWAAAEPSCCGTGLQRIWAAVERC